MSIKRNNYSLNMVYQFLKVSLAIPPQEAAEAADKIGGNMWVVKTQVHAGWPW